MRLGACYYNDDNELIVVAQKLHTYTVTNKSGSGNSTTYTTTTYYVYGDVISFKLDADGKVEEFGFVPHYHESTTDSWRDYSAIFNNNKLCIVNGLSGCEVKFNNTSYAYKELYKPEDFNKGTIYTYTISIADNELLQILTQQLKISFVALAVKDEEK